MLRFFSYKKEEEEKAKKEEGWSKRGQNTELSSAGFTF